MRFYTSPGAAAAKLPFSQAVQVGDVLYLSGALGNKPGTREVVAGGIAAEIFSASDCSVTDRWRVTKFLALDNADTWS